MCGGSGFSLAPCDYVSGCMVRTPWSETFLEFDLIWFGSERRDRQGGVEGVDLESTSTVASSLFFALTVHGPV